MQLYEGFGPTEMSGFKLYHVFLPIRFTKIQYYEEFLTSENHANIGITVFFRDPSPSGGPQTAKRPPRAIQNLENDPKLRVLNTRKYRQK